MLYVCSAATFAAGANARNDNDANAPFFRGLCGKETLPINSAAFDAIDEFSEPRDYFAIRRGPSSDADKFAGELFRRRERLDASFLIPLGENFPLSSSGYADSGEGS